MRNHFLDGEKNLDFVISGEKRCHFIKDLMLIFCLHNLAQNVVEKFTKLSKIDFSMECFTADFS